MKINASIRHQTLSCFCANLIVMSRGSAAGFFSANFLAFQRQDTPLPSGPLTLGEATLVLSIVHIGAIIGNLIFPMFVRRFGCKRTLLVLGYPQIFFWILMINAQNVYYYCIAHFLEGFITAGLAVSVPMFVVEVAHDNIRGTLNAFYDPSYYIGMITTFLLATCFDIIEQAKFLIAVPIVFIILFTAIPQTPHHLFKVDDNDAAIKATKFFKGIDIEKPSADQVNTTSNTENYKLTLSDFTNPRARKAILLTFGLMCLFPLQGLDTLNSYVTEIFSSVNPNIPSLYASAITTMIVMMGSLIFINLVERFNRRTLFIGSAIATAIGHISFALYLYFLSNNRAFDWFPVVCIPYMLFVSTLGMSPITWLMVLEISPKKIKEIVYSGGYLMILIHLFVLVQSYPILKLQIGLSGVITIFATASSCTAIFGYFFLPETRGKSHEEIMEMLDK